MLTSRFGLKKCGFFLLKFAAGDTRDSPKVWIVTCKPHTASKSSHLGGLHVHKLLLKHGNKCSKLLLKILVDYHKRKQRKQQLGLGQTSNLSRVEFIKNRFDKEST